MNTEVRGAGRRTLLWLAVVFFAPLALAFFVYYGTGWRPGGATNNGELIAPARALPDSPATRTGDGVKIFDNKWSLVVLNNGDCVADCLQRLDYVRQTLASLGRLQSRTQLVLVYDGNCCNTDLRALGYNDLLTINGAAAPGLLHEFPNADRARMIYVVDPLGNLMMRYDRSLDPKGLRADIKHLLDLSQIG